MAVALAAAALAPGDEVDLRINTPHPRLFLGQRRLRLLRRERERQSLRWNQFQLLMAGKAPMPEPGFANALYYQVSGNTEAGRQAVTWALGAGTDLRQLALVFDWCQDILTEQQSHSLAAKIATMMQRSAKDSSVPMVRSRLLAALALSGHVPDTPERELERVVNKWWTGQFAPALAAGREAAPRDAVYALMEILHAVRDNLQQDLREGAPHFFENLPMVQLLSYYPARYPAGENEYRIPASAKPEGDPDLKRAALSRAAELSMVAYDSNAAGSQLLQGWLMNDDFLLRGTFGIPYEFLWANPYQPGLSFHLAPLLLHDETFGRLFVRSSWLDSAVWLGAFEDVLQVFEEGRITVLDVHQDSEPLNLKTATIVFGAQAAKFRIKVEGEGPVFVVGVKPRRTFLVEVDDEEMCEAQSDPGGNMMLDLPHGVEVGVRMREAAAAGFRAN